MYYYILCLAEMESGGSELAHQLCHVLLQQGHQAYMYYTHSEQMEPVDAETPVKYCKYGTKHIKSFLDIKMESVAIIPEGWTGMVSALPMREKVVWWMSVDNYIAAAKENDLKNLEKTVFYHLVQSYYAKEYLLEHTKISADRILYVSDYIGDSYGQFIFPAQYRQNIVLYNPRKGFEDLYPVIAMMEGVKWVPLKGMTEEQMVVMMQTAKAYVDFGPHSGKDRIPREAASCGCCVITNKKGSAAFYEDVSIPDEYKFEDVHSSYGKIAFLLKDICENYELHVDKFGGYRKFIAGEKEQFAEDVRKMAETLQREFGIERKNILLVKGITSYGISDRYMGEIESAIWELGCNTYVMDVRSLASPTQCNHMLATCRFDAVIDIGGIFCKYDVVEKLPKDTIYGVYLYEPLQLLDKNLKKVDDRTIVFCCDNEFQNYIRQFYPNIKHTKFVPLSGRTYPESVPYEDRKIDIMFAGAYKAPEKIKSDALTKMEGRDVLVKFIEDMFSDIITNTQHTLSDCLTAVLKKYELAVSDAEFDELMGEFIDVHLYACSYYQDRLIRVLLDAGLVVHVFGEGWDTFVSEQKENLIIHMGGTYAEQKALADSKIALSIMPWLKDGFWDRIAGAMLSKTVAVTNENKYIDANFEAGKHLVVYSLKDIESLAAQIKYLLAEPQKAVKIAENGYQKVQNHTWEKRVYDMLWKMEADFGISFIQEGKGKRRKLEAAYPDQRAIKLDAIYELQKMVDLADYDIGKIEIISNVEREFLLNQFHEFAYKFGQSLPNMEMNTYILECMRNPEQKELKHDIEFFSIQCQAWMGDLLLDVGGLNP